MLVNVLRKILPGWVKRAIRGLLTKLGAHVTEGALAAHNDTVMLLDQKIERVYHEMLERQDELFCLLEKNLRNEIQGELQAAETRKTNPAVPSSDGLDGEVAHEAGLTSLYHACIADIPNPVVCELLTGPGDFLAWLAEVGLQGVGCEPRSEPCRRAQSRGLQVQLKEPHEFLTEQPPGAYDVIISRVASRRLPYGDLRAIMQGAYRVLREGGRVVLKAAESGAGAPTLDGSTSTAHPALSPNESDFVELMSAIGFRSIRLQKVDCDEEPDVAPVKARSAGVPHTGEPETASGGSLRDWQRSMGYGGSWVVASK